MLVQGASRNYPPPKIRTPIGKEARNKHREVPVLAANLCGGRDILFLEGWWMFSESQWEGT